MTRRWERAAVGGLAVVAALLYGWGIGTTGWANVYYSAAAQAGAADWTAFLFGSSDAGNSITIDKPPASIWLMALSARAFGVNPFAVMLPQALLGMATALLTYLLVRLCAPAAAALFAGLAVAVMPASTLMFRYNNPDALLVLLIVAALYAAMRILGGGRLGWYAALGTAFGAAFLTKQLQAFLVLPVVFLVVLWGSPRPRHHRLVGVATAAGALVLTAGWWVAMTILTPTASRPWIGGSADNSFLSLTLGYNGLGRLVGGDGNPRMMRAAGIDRLFIGSSGQLIGWLLPAALLLSIAAVILLRGAWRRPDLELTTRTLFAGSLVFTVAALSAMTGIYHAYYTVAAAPLTAAAAATGAATLWQRREQRVARAVLAISIAVTGVYASLLLSGAGAAQIPLRALLPFLGIAAAALILGADRDSASRTTALAVAAAVALGGPFAASVAVAGVGHSGSSASALAPSTAAASASLGVDPQITDALCSHAVSFRWAAATARGSTVAARFQLTSGAPVMPIGGFKRSDPSPTLSQFQSYVDAGLVHWYIGTDTSAISAWVQKNYAPQQIGGLTLFDLSVPAGTPSPSPVLSAAPGA